MDEAANKLMEKKCDQIYRRGGTNKNFIIGEGGHVRRREDSDSGRQFYTGIDETISNLDYRQLIGETTMAERTDRMKSKIFISSLVLAYFILILRKDSNSEGLIVHYYVLEQNRFINK